MLVLRDNVTTRLHVQCYPGRKADETPHHFQLNTHEYFAEEVVDQWYGPKHVFFKLRADDGNIYILRHQISVPNGDWDLVSFLETRPAK